MFLTEEQLAARLKAGTLDRVYLVYGDDGYMKRVYADRIVNAVLGDDSLRFFNFHEYEEDNTPFADVFADADNLPVMSERTCLLVKDYPLSGLSAKEFEAFVQSLKNVPETAVIVFAFLTVDFTRNQYDYPKWQNVIKAFGEAGTAAELTHRTGNRLVRMLVKGAKDRGAELSAADAQYLIDVTGEDTGHLLNEIGKLCAYADGQAVTREMIDRVVTKTVEASVFDISDAILRGDPDEALATAFELLRRKVPIQSIIGALSSAYVNLYRLVTAAGDGKRYADFAETFGYKSSYGVQKAAPYARNRTPARAREAIEILLEADVITKSRAFDPETLLTELVCRLAAV